MSNIIACYKWVLDEADLKINADLSVDMSKAKGKISDYDKNAIEAAVIAAKDLGGKPIGLTFGNEKTQQSLKDALSRGLDEVYWVKVNDDIGIDNLVSSKVLAEAIKKIGDYSIIFCAEGSSDVYARQTASRIGAVLDIPVITSVSEIEVNESSIVAVRKLDDSMERVKANFPVVVSVLPEANTPTIPGLKAVTAARKKPVNEIVANDLGVSLDAKVIEKDIKGYATNRKNIIFGEGDVANKVKDLVAALRKEGVV